MLQKLVQARVLCAVLMLLYAVAVPVAAQDDKRSPIDPAFSGDGQQIVYLDQVRRGGELLPSLYEIWIVNRDGTHARRLTEGPRDEKPRLSPDGKSIVFLRDNDIWIINADGSGLRNVTNTKDIVEGGVEFTNDGQSLLFLRAVPDEEALKREAELRQSLKLPVYTPAFPPMIPQVVLRSLQDGSERVVLRDTEGFAVEQVVPNPLFDNAAFMLCKPLDNNGKPVAAITFDKAIAVLKFDGSVPRNVFEVKPELKTRIKRMRISLTRNVLEVDTPDEFSDQVGLMEDGTIKILPNAPSFGDVSRDGSTLVGTGIVDDKFNHGLVLYDLATQKSRPLIQAPGTIPTEAKEHFELGMKHFHDDEYAVAIVEYTQAIRLHPQYAEAFHYRGWTHDLNDNTTAALRDLGEAIRLDPQDAYIYLTRARILEKQERTGEALDDYTAAIRVDPQNRVAYYERGRIYLKRLEADQAIADFNEAIKIDPDNLSYLMARGDALLAQGDNAGALADYSAAIKYYPNWAEAYANRAKVYRAMGKASLAKADEQKAKQLKNKN